MDTSKVTKNDKNSTENNGSCKKTETNEQHLDDIKSSEGGDDEEDIPQDFFDDFSNPDFMEGLNIVDAWDDDNSNAKEDHSSKDKNDKDDKRRSRDQKERRKRSPRRERRSRSRERHRSRDRRRRSLSRGRKRSSSRSKKTRIKDRSETDLRRDPQKSKRDIEIYKVKCDKDKEQKNINEKLKVVETGLVPPGMEMDVDINEVLKQAAQEVSEEQNVPCPELDDSWQTHPTLRSSKPVYPDLKPSAVVSEEVLRETKRRRRTRSRSGEVVRRKEIEYSKRRSSPPRRHPSPYRRSSPSYRRHETPPNVRMHRSPPTEIAYRDIVMHHEIPMIENAHPVSPTRYDFGHRSPTEIYDRFENKSMPRDIMLDIREYELERKRDKRTPVKVNRRRSCSSDRELSKHESNSRQRKSGSNDRSASRSSPKSRRRRSRSLSERERWIRDPKREWRNRHRSKSRDSPKRRRRHDEKKDKKISFLEEIHQLLSGSAKPSVPPQNVLMNTPHIPAHHAPAPVPAPIPPLFQHYQQPVPPQQFDLYDPRFFIGDDMLPNNNIVLNTIPGSVIQAQPGSPMMMAPHPQVSGQGPGLGMTPASHFSNMQIPPPHLVPMPGVNLSQKPLHVPVPPVPAPAPKSVNTNVINLDSNLQSQQNIQAQSTQDDTAKRYNLPNDKPLAKKEAKKLFEEKKITLSDFLSISAQLEDFSTPLANLPKKIQVISRCQEVLKKFGDDKAGRFVLTKIWKSNESKLKYESPLVVNPISYECTTPHDPGKEPFMKKLSKALTSIGISAASADEVVKSEIQRAPPSPPAAPQITPTKSNSMLNQGRKPNKMVQTDVVKCKVCEERDNVIYSHTETQCTPTVRSIGIQVSDDPVREMLKNKSLASLTPAQLLMKEEKGTSNTHSSSNMELLRRDHWKPPPGLDRGRFSPPQGRSVPYVPPAPSLDMSPHKRPSFMSDRNRDPFGNFSSSFSNKDRFYNH